MPKKNWKMISLSVFNENIGCKMPPPLFRPQSFKRWTLFYLDCSKYRSIWEVRQIICDCITIFTHWMWMAHMGTNTAWEKAFNCVKHHTTYSVNLRNRRRLTACMNLSSCHHYCWYSAKLFHAPTRTSSGCLKLHRTVLWNLFGNTYKNRAAKEEETVVWWGYS